MTRGATLRSSLRAQAGLIAESSLCVGCLHRSSCARRLEGPLTAAILAIRAGGSSIVSKQHAAGTVARPSCTRRTTTAVRKRRRMVRFVHLCTEQNAASPQSHACRPVHDNATACGVIKAAAALSMCSAALEAVHSPAYGSRTSWLAGGTPGALGRLAGGSSANCDATDNIADKGSVARIMSRPCLLAFQHPKARQQLPCSWPAVWRRAAWVQRTLTAAGVSAEPRIWEGGAAARARARRVIGGSATLGSHAPDKPLRHRQANSS